MKEYVLVFAPPGVRLGATIEHLQRELDAEALDIDDWIKRSPDTQIALNEIKAIFAPPLNMETVAFNLPRSKVAELWKSAVKACLEELDKSPKETKILSGHLTYYSGQRNEFYSVVDIDSLIYNHEGRRLQPKSVVVLIDDIYDMYARLPELYSPDYLGDLLAKAAKEEKVEVSKLPADRNAYTISGWKMKSLLHLLSWRHIEPIIAENLALQLRQKTGTRVRYMVWALKQLTRTVSGWIGPFNYRSVYLSHPISEPRRLRNDPGTDKWLPIVKEINALQGAMLDHQVALVMPTGIDEYRFHVDSNKYTGYLTDRWELISNTAEELLYLKPDGIEDCGHRQVLRPHIWDVKKKQLSPFAESEFASDTKTEISVFVQVLRQEVEAQIATRDFLFVHNTEGLLVYRPFFAAREPRSTMSGGVDAEIRLWENLAQLRRIDEDRPQSRAAFLHLDIDVLNMMEARGPSLFEALVDAILKRFSVTFPIRRDVIQDLLRGKGVIAANREVLGGSRIATHDRRLIERMFSENVSPAKTDLLNKYLTAAVDTDDSLVGVWIVRDESAVHPELKNIASFLSNGTPRGNGWKDRIDHFFPDTLIYR